MWQEISAPAESDESLFFHPDFRSAASEFLDGVAEAFALIINFIPFFRAEEEREISLTSDAVCLDDEQQEAREWDGSV